MYDRRVNVLSLSWASVNWSTKSDFSHNFHGELQPSRPHKLIAYDKEDAKTSCVLMMLEPRIILKFHRLFATIFYKKNDYEQRIALRNEH